MKVKIGTIKRSLLEGTRSAHEFIITNIYFIPSGGFCLPIPQHWDQAQGGNNYKTRRVIKDTTFDKVVLFWNRRKLQLTIPLGK